MAFNVLSNCRLGGTKKQTVGLRAAQMRVKEAWERAKRPT